MRRENVPTGASLATIDPASSSYDYLKARYYEIEFHRRFAFPTACLVLALVGIPLGLSAHKGGRSAGFVLTIVLVFVYYFFSLVGVSLARQGKLSPVARSLGWQHLLLPLRTVPALAHRSHATRPEPASTDIGAALGKALDGLNERLPTLAAGRGMGAFRKKPPQALRRAGSP